MSLGILGYGKLGKALARILLERGCDVFVFSDREKVSGRRGGDIFFYPSSYLKEKRIPMDALLLAHGSIGTYKAETLSLLKNYNVISAYDIHSDLSSFLENADRVAKQNQTIAVLGIGWDPGLLSLARALSFSVFPEVSPKTEWGVGVSEGHSHAIQRIHGVREGIQYTHPTENGHRRVCYVVCDAGEEKRIEWEIKRMKEYFSPQTTEVHFISEDEFQKNHKGNAFHRGKVSATLPDDSASISFEVSMKRNPDFTARIMLAYIVALQRFREKGSFGAFSPLDIPLSYLLEKNAPFMW